MLRDTIVRSPYSDGNRITILPITMRWHYSHPAARQSPGGAFVVMGPSVSGGCAVYGYNFLEGFYAKEVTVPRERLCVRSIPYRYCRCAGIAVYLSGCLRVAGSNASDVTPVGGAALVGAAGSGSRLTRPRVDAYNLTGSRRAASAGLTTTTASHGANIQRLTALPVTLRFMCESTSRSLYANGGCAMSSIWLVVVAAMLVAACSVSAECAS